MRSIIPTTLAMDDSLNTHEPFPLDPSLEQSITPEPQLFSLKSPFPAPELTTSHISSMDLQYILSPVVLDDRSQKNHSHMNQSQTVDTHLMTLQPAVIQPVSSSSRSGGIPPAPLVVRRPAEHVHPNPDDAIISFDSTTRTFPKPIKPSTPSVADPYAEGFLRDMLGSEKWETFSSRLFERRLGGKGKGKVKGKPGEDDDTKSGVSAIEFLVKVEVVKEILRTYVPHPYNPLKSLTHPYPRAPSGQVTLTRSTVLLLSGWSNTQFSYWARRAEAVSVLAEYDDRLRAVGNALERRLSGQPSGDEVENKDCSLVTGKGLDAIVDEVKKRTGKSQFLRGKHSSLDPYGTTAAEVDTQNPPLPPDFAMPTFQAKYYNHLTSIPRKQRTLQSLVIPSVARSVNTPVPPKRRLKPPLEIPPRPETPPDSGTPSSDQDTTPVSPSSTSSTQTDLPSPRMTRSSTRKSGVSDNNTHPFFPLSDSRSEVESTTSSASAKRKPSVGDSSSQKRPRTFLSDGES